MKSRANFPRRVCTSQLRRNISSDCASVSPDVAITESTCSVCDLSTAQNRLTWARDGVTIPAEDTGTSVSIPPLSQRKKSPAHVEEMECEVNLGWNDVESKEWIERGVEKDALVSLCVYICGTCLSQCMSLFWVRMLTESTCVNGSAMLECGAITRLWLCTHGLSPCFWGDLT